MMPAVHEPASDQQNAPLGSSVVEPDITLPTQMSLLVVSDLHIGDGGRDDLFGVRRDDLFAAFLARESAEVDGVVLNGDVLDHMQVRDDTDIERAHPRALDALRELATRRPVYMVLGNHDDPDRARATFPDYSFHDAIAVGDDTCITHGHQFDLYWGARPSLVTARFHSMLERRLRARIRVPLRDHNNLPNRVIHRLYFRWTQLLRLHAAMRRALGDGRPYERWLQFDRFWSRSQWGDLGNVYHEALQYLGRQAAPWRMLVVGHSHQPGVVARRGRTYVNSGSWCLGDACFARLCDGEARAFDAVSGLEYGDTRYLALENGVELPDLAGWFRRYYRGFFSYDMRALVRDYPLEMALDEGLAAEVARFS